MDNKDEKTTFYDTATKVVGVVAIGAVVSLISWMRSGSEKNDQKVKMMKAPGGGGYTIPRASFVANPKDHFKNQRQLNKK
ncbi:unnamed protein product [Cochlearia groenlandica]